MRLSTTLLSSLLFASSALAANKQAIKAFKRFENKPVAQRSYVEEEPERPRLQKRASPFLNPASQQFVVNGSAIPDIPWDLGESYAGLLPISDNPAETRKLYFWFFPSANPLASANKEIVIWFNGGPGCSSLLGFLTENGPVLWQDGTLAPTKNPYSWTNLTNMVWVEQPVGVGFTQGKPNITDEVQLANQFTGFWKNFVKTFQIQNYNMFIAGESYAGYYVPYVADAFLSKNDTTNFNLIGASIIDPILGNEVLQQSITTRPFVEYWSKLFYLNDTFMDQMRKRDAQCNYTQYYEKYFTFPPPPGPFPLLPDPFLNPNGTCDMLDNYYNAILETNPCFNIYHITDTCPFPWDHLGIVNTGDYNPPGNVVYFNRTDVQKAINAPVGTNWEQCTEIDVFGYNNNTQGDRSLGPADDGVLQRVIERTNRVQIGSGNLDFLLNTNGTLFVLQNMTWNGKQGFSSYPNNTFYVPYHPEYNEGRMAEAGEVGYWIKERSLTFYTVQLAGHEIPGYAAGAGYRQLELLLGRIANLSQTGDFTTQTGNYTGVGQIYKKKPLPHFNYLEDDGDDF